MVIDISFRHINMKYDFKFLKNLLLIVDFGKDVVDCQHENQSMEGLGTINLVP